MVLFVWILSVSGSRKPGNGVVIVIDKLKHCYKLVGKVQEDSKEPNHISVGEVFGIVIWLTYT